MAKLEQTTKIVKAILEDVPQTRNSDTYLYLKVLEYVAEREGMDLHEISVYSFLMDEHIYFPGFETVRRTRQKIQQTCPWLGSCEKVHEWRSENERQYRKWVTNMEGCSGNA